MTEQTVPTRRGRVLTIWTPEDRAFWEAEGRAIAQLNLWISVPCLFLAFAVWQLWSVVAVNLNALGFRFTTNQLFWLAAAPALSGRPAHLLLVHGADLRWPALDRVIDRQPLIPASASASQCRIRARAIRQC
jgi:hypothetical protein